MSTQLRTPLGRVRGLGSAKNGTAHWWIQRLTALQTELERMLEQCACGTIADCRVIEVLGNHDLCVQDHKAEEPA